MYYFLSVNRLLVLCRVIWAKLGLFCNWFEGYFLAEVNLSSFCEVPLNVLLTFKPETDMARAYRPKPGSDDVVSIWWDHGGIEVKFYVCPMQNSWEGRKEEVKAQSQKNVLLVEERKAWRKAVIFVIIFKLWSDQRNIYDRWNWTGDWSRLSEYMWTWFWMDMQSLCWRYSSCQVTLCGVTRWGEGWPSWFHLL